MKAIQNLFLLQLSAIEMTASNVNYSDPTTARALNDIAEVMRNGFEQYMQEYIHDALTGKGPVAELNRKLGRAKGEIGNHLMVVDEPNRLSRSDIIGLLEKYVSTKVTRFSEGGLAEPKFTRPEGRFDLLVRENRSGFYPNLNGYRDKNQIVVSVQNGYGLYSHVVVTLETGYRSDGQGTVSIKIHSFHPLEDEWYVHQNYEVIDKHMFERAFVELLEDKGCEVVKKATPIQPVLDYIAEITPNDFTPPYYRDFSVETNNAQIAYVVNPNKRGGEWILTVRKDDSTYMTWEQMNFSKQRQMATAILGQLESMVSEINPEAIDVIEKLDNLRAELGLPELSALEA